LQGQQIIETRVREQELGDQVIRGRDLKTRAEQRLVESPIPDEREEE